MAAASYSSDVLERYYGRIDEAIQSLPEPLVPRPVPRFDGWQHRKILTPSDILHTRIFQILEAIKNLPLEILEKIYKEFVTIKLRERKEMGWNEVHNDIEEAPFCEKLQRITKVCYCRNCTSCRINGRCYECIKKGENHYLDFPYPTFETYNENFQKFY